MTRSKENTERFTGRVEMYERFRMRYPTEVIRMLERRCGLERRHTVVDVGAGTGMLAELFLRNGNGVIAIEPNAEMRAACERMQEEWPALRVVAGTAEETGLESGSMDFVVAGRAFHWFDGARALAEFRRVLRPGGWVALVSAGRAQTDTEQGRAYERMLDEQGTDYEYVRGGHRVHERLGELFGDAGGSAVWSAQIGGEQVLDLEQLTGQTMSLSVAPLPGDPGHAEMLRAIEEFFRRFSKEGAVRVPTTCWINCGQFR